MKTNILLTILALLTIGILLSQATNAYEYDDKAMTWALGENWGNLPIYMIDDIWNERHGDIFVLLGTEFPHEALVRMENAYWCQTHTIKDLEFDVEEYLDAP